MKNIIKIIFLFLSLSPIVAFADFVIPIKATSTTQTLWAFPTPVNGIYYSLVAPNFIGTSSASTSYMLGPLAIGSTTVGGSRLLVAGDANIVGATSNNAQLRIAGATTPTKRLNIGYDTTNDLSVIQSVDSGVAFKILSINPGGGNVGIGTTSPWANLSVNGTAGQSGAGSPVFVIGTSTSGFATNTAFMVGSNGAVGIGTTTTSLAQFSVSGAPAGSGTPTLLVNKRPGDNCIISLGGMTYTTVFCSDTGGSSNLGTLIYHNETVAGRRAFDVVNPQGIKLTVDGNGNVGVGTSSPAYSLSVSNNSASTPLLGIDARSGQTAPIANVTLASTTVFYIDNAGKVGVGTSSPVAPLTVEPSSLGGIRINPLGAGNGNGQSWMTSIRNSSNSDSLSIGQSSSAYTTGGSLGWLGNSEAFIYYPTTLRIGTGVGSTPVVSLTSTGLVGIGTSSPWRTFSVTGTVGFDGITTATLKNALCIDGTTKEVVTAGNTTCTTSSAKTKENIDEITETEADRIISELKPVAFNYRDGGDRRVGFIAEDVNKVDSRLVEYASEDTFFPHASSVIKKGEPISVEYGNITALLVKKIQSLETGARHSVEEDWQWICIGLLFAGLIYQQIQIKILKK